MTKGEFCLCGHRQARHNTSIHKGCLGPAAENEIRCPCGQFRALELGTYQHYRGGIYDLITIGVLSEDRHQPVAIYQSRKMGTTWVRPLAMFLEEVVHEGVRLPRFRKVGEGDGEEEGLSSVRRPRTTP